MERNSLLFVRAWIKKIRIFKEVITCIYEIILNFVVSKLAGCLLLVDCRSIARAAKLKSLNTCMQASAVVCCSASLMLIDLKTLGHALKDATTERSGSRLQTNNIYTKYHTKDKQIQK